MRSAFMQRQVAWRAVTPCLRAEDRLRALTALSARHRRFLDEIIDDRTDLADGAGRFEQFPLFGDLAFGELGGRLLGVADRLRPSRRRAETVVIS